MPGLEHPIDPTAPYRSFAQGLRRLRPPGLTYKEMSRRTHEAGMGYSAAALSQAANGRALPSRNLTRAYVTACEAEAEIGLQLHRRALSNGPDTEDGSLAHSRSVLPGTCASAAEFVAGLNALRKYAGLTLRDVEMISKRRMRYPLPGLAKSSIGDMLNRPRLPDHGTCSEFVDICIEQCVTNGYLPPERRKAVVQEWISTLHRLSRETALVSLGQPPAERSAPLPHPEDVEGLDTSAPPVEQRRMERADAARPAQSRRPRWRFWVPRAAPAR